MSRTTQIAYVNGQLAVVANEFHSKFWVARLTGLDAKYTFTREFVGGGSRKMQGRILQTTGSSSGIIEKKGIYQVRCVTGHGTLDYFVNVTDGKNGIYEVIEGQDKYTRAIEIVKNNN